MLILKLGNHWLEVGSFRNAITCLQRVWMRERLLKHQQERLKTLEKQFAAGQAAQDPYQKILYSRLIDEVRRETGNFEKIENFDAALRLRLAVAYLQMKRYREAALIMANMLDELPPDKTTEQAAVNVVRCWSALEDWPQAIEAAHRFVSKFPDSSLVPQVLLLEAEAYQSSLRYEEAAGRSRESRGDFLIRNTLRVPSI
jgi:tetratricopeptide (TPR) repeat protein